MDFDIGHWIELAKHNPLLIVLVVGTIGGVAVTQLVKATYLAFANGSRISDKRYRVSVQWLAALLTFLITNELWELMIAERETALRHVVSAVSGVLAPHTYNWAKAGIAWKWPALADKFGDSKHGDK